MEQRVGEAGGLLGRDGAQRAHGRLAHREVAVVEGADDLAHRERTGRVLERGDGRRAHGGARIAQGAREAPEPRGALEPRHARELAEQRHEGGRVEWGGAEEAGRGGGRP
ncbi:MAG: hypothetical protein M5U28_04655 [Sandaracinaceae bacterium]|nr:hypothetical protein [Sandaracinaceae bacterium]